MSAPSLPIITVMSATSKTGAAAVRALSASGAVEVRAVSRNIASDAAAALGSLPRVVSVAGDFTDGASVAAALAGARGAMLVSPGGSPTQFDAETSFVEAAVSAGVDVVRVSTGSILIGDDSPVAFGREHRRVEAFIEAHATARVVDLNPNGYMDNLLGAAGEVQATGQISFPVRGDLSRNAYVDTRDIGGAAAAILLQPRATFDLLLSKRRRIEVHGPKAVTLDEQVNAIAIAAGRAVSLKVLSKPSEWGDMLKSWGVPTQFADDLVATELIAAGIEPTQRPRVTESSPELLAFWAPKHSIHDWADHHKSLFIKVDVDVATTVAPSGTILVAS